MVNLFLMIIVASYHQLVTQKAVANMLHFLDITMNKMQNCNFCSNEPAKKKLDRVTLAKDIYLVISNLSHTC